MVMTSDDNLRLTFFEVANSEGLFKTRIKGEQSITLPTPHVISIHSDLIGFKDLIPLAINIYHSTPSLNESNHSHTLTMRWVPGQAPATFCQLLH